MLHTDTTSTTNTTNSSKKKASCYTPSYASNGSVLMMLLVVLAWSPQSTESYCLQNVQVRRHACASVKATNPLFDSKMTHPLQLNAVTMTAHNFLKSHPNPKLRLELWNKVRPLAVIESIAKRIRKTISFVILSALLFFAIPDVKLMQPGGSGGVSVVTCNRIPAALARSGGSIGGRSSSSSSSSRGSSSRSRSSSSSRSSGGASARSSPGGGSRRRARDPPSSAHADMDSLFTMEFPSVSFGHQRQRDHNEVGDMVQLAAYPAVRPRVMVVLEEALVLALIITVIASKSSAGISNLKWQLFSGVQSLTWRSTLQTVRMCFVMTEPERADLIAKLNKIAEAGDSDVQGLVFDICVALQRLIGRKQCLVGGSMEMVTMGNSPANRDRLAKAFARTLIAEQSTFDDDAPVQKPAVGSMVGTGSEISSPISCYFMTTFLLNTAGPVLKSSGWKAAYLPTAGFLQIAAKKALGMETGRHVAASRPSGRLLTVEDISNYLKSLPNYLSSISDFEDRIQMHESPSSEALAASFDINVVWQPNGVGDSEAFSLEEIKSTWPDIEIF